MNIIQHLKETMSPQALEVFERAGEEAQDALHNDVQVKLSFRDRLRVLVHGKLALKSVIYCANQPGRTAADCEVSIPGVRQHFKRRQPMGYVESSPDTLSTQPNCPASNFSPFPHPIKLVEAPDIYYCECGCRFQWTDETHWRILDESFAVEAAIRSVGGDDKALARAVSVLERCKSKTDFSHEDMCELAMCGIPVFSIMGTPEAKAAPNKVSFFRNALGSHFSSEPLMTKGQQI